MDILDALSFLGELLAYKPKINSTQKSHLAKSNSKIQLLSALFSILAFIISIIEINSKYAPANFWLTPLLVFILSLFISIGFSILLNRVFNIQYTYTNFIMLIITMTLFVSALTFSVNRMTNQLFFKLTPHSSNLNCDKDQPKRENQYYSNH